MACGGNSEREGEKSESGWEKKPKFLIQLKLQETVYLSTLNLPEGFEISIYAEVENARSMALSESGTLFVGEIDKKIKFMQVKILGW